ncbi:MAG: threonine--tRNA ligase [Candidatus Omnitrophica bacterium]|nr:threonine--tRNA ligase [Candidatus Omnitrophota bacterium]
MKKEEMKTYWHTSSHILAQAVKRLYPETELGIGPAIEEGFYYDFYREEPFTPQDIEKITAEMEKIINENLPIERLEYDKKQAEEIIKNESFKLEILKEIPDEKVSFYRQGGFIDLCKGPHQTSTGEIKFFKLLSISSSYWKGNEKNPSMQRIYGISFPRKKELEEYLKRIEEAKLRDHRIIGPKTGLFSLHQEFGPGLVFWHPKGAMIRKIIEDFWKEIHIENGYDLLYTPHIASIKLWEKSGHVEFYKENMYPPMEIDEKILYQLKPMNCPFHILVYQDRVRSYRELPLRWAELGTVYRLEKIGVLHGLLRVRGFTQDDAHVFCRTEQIEDEVMKILGLVVFFLESFGFDQYEVFLSTRPKKFVGSVENWEKATDALTNALKKKEFQYQVDPGEGVFYGPKIDIKVRDCLNRLWQCTTIQVDFNIPERFNLKFVNEKNEFEQPIMIHRAIMGSLERFFGILIEHYNGNFPLWISPVQVKILPISEKFLEYGEKIFKMMQKEKFRVQIDASQEKLNKKIKIAEEEKIPYIFIVGEKEERENNIAVRKHGKGMLGTFTVEDIIKILKEEANTKNTKWL